MHKHTQLFDSLYCLRAYPEFRELVTTHMTAQRIAQNNQTLHDILAAAFKERYPDTPCIDPTFNAEYYARRNQFAFESFEEAYEHWLTVGKQQGLSYAPGKNTSLTVILKTYNEDFFIEEWLSYYEQIVGLEHIVVFDHSSTTPATLHAYKKRKNLLVIRVPRTVTHDTLHNTRHFHIIFTLLKQHTLFFTLLDTDEFLCRFNGTQIVASGITERLQELKSEVALGTVWLTNYFTGTTAHKPSDVLFFNTNDQPIRHSIQTSKNIFRYDAEHVIIGHNKGIPNIAIASDLLLLHTKRANIPERIASQIRACVSFGLINADDSTETILTKLSAIHETTDRHGVKEVVGYLSNPHAYSTKMTDYDPTVCVSTNIIAATLYGEPLQYSFTHPTHVNLDTLIRNRLPEVIERLAPGAHLTPLSVQPTSTTQ